MAEFTHCVDEVWERQKGLCGLCGETLRGHDWDAHHVDGKPGNDWSENCVLLCTYPTDNCHHFAHDFDWQLGALLRQEEFPYWNGKGFFENLLSL
jgi:hypothetical protein